MPLVLYTGNLDGSGTDELLLANEDGRERKLVRNGPSLEITDAEYARLRGRYSLTILDEAEPGEHDVPDSPSPAVSSVTVGTQPASGSAPNQSASAESSDSSDSSDSSGKTDSNQLPTPPAGN